MISIIKRLDGYSGSQVLLMEGEDGRAFVRKIGQVDRNLERMMALSDLGIRTPRILGRSDDHYDMEYLRHVDMANWLLHNPVDRFVSWILGVVDAMGRDPITKDYRPIYEAKLGAIEPHLTELPFTSGQLIDRLPRHLPSGQYHGDLTMDNCLHGVDGDFYLIDPLTTEYDSWVFDLAKLMQDLDCGWFIRHRDLPLHGKLWSMRMAVTTAHPVAGDPTLLILMLLRVLPYARNDSDRTFLIREIRRLWT